MIIISVDQPFSLTGKGHCYFKREIVSNESVSLPMESIVNVLHLLFSGVPHEVNIKYQY